MIRDEKYKGFSLIELMIVIAIIGILVAVALPRFASMTEDAKKGKAKSDVMVIAKAIAKYNSFEGLPCENLIELKGKYMSNIETVRDPWGARYCYDAAYGTVYSKGPDGRHTPNKGKTWKDDISVEVYDSLCLLEASVEVDPDVNTDENTAYDRLYLLFNKPVLLEENVIDIGPELSASTDIKKYKKGIDKDARDGKVFRWYEGAKPRFKADYSPFPADTQVFVRTTEDPREIVLVFPPGMTEVFQTTTYLNMCGAKKDPNPLFRALNKEQGACSTGTPVKIKPYEGAGIEVDDEIANIVNGQKEYNAPAAIGKGRNFHEMGED